MAEVECGIANYVETTEFSPGELRSCVVVIDGPDQDGEIVILAGAETYLPRDVAFKLANEILLRLKEGRG